MRLNDSFRYALYGVFSALFLTGVFWLAADRLKESPEGEMWQVVGANLLMVHGGAAMAALLLVGALFPMHVQRSWRARKNTVTGAGMVGLSALLVVTAFGLYYFGVEVLRPWMSDIHLVAGCVAPGLLLIHIYWGRRGSKLARRQSGEARRPVPAMQLARESEG